MLNLFILSCGKPHILIIDLKVLVQELKDPDSKLSLIRLD